MELFLPSILVFILAALIVMIVIPNFSPLIIVILSVILLTAGTYQHFQLFWNEYRTSQWQTTLKIFAPGIIIAAVFFYIFIAGTTVLTSGASASMPPMELPPASTATNSFTSAINTTMSAVDSAANSIGKSVTSTTSALTDSLGLSSMNQSKRNSGSANSKGPTTSALALI